MCVGRDAVDVADGPDVVDDPHPLIGAERAVVIGLDAEDFEPNPVDTWVRAGGHQQSRVVIRRALELLVELNVDSVAFESYADEIADERRFLGEEVLG